MKLCDETHIKSHLSKVTLTHTSRCSQRAYGKCRFSGELQWVEKWRGEMMKWCPTPGNDLITSSTFNLLLHLQAIKAPFPVSECLLNHKVNSCCLSLERTKTGYVSRHQGVSEVCLIFSSACIDTISAVFFFVTVGITWWFMKEPVNVGIT